jgi:hypothetical protein
VSGFIQKNWQWLWAAIVVPIAGYLWTPAEKPRAPKPNRRRFLPSVLVGAMSSL